MPHAPTRIGSIARSARNQVNVAVKHGLARDARAFVYQSDALAWAEEVRLAVLPAVQL